MLILMTNLVLSDYEAEALTVALKKHIIILDEQITGLKKLKHSSPAQKKEMQRSINKRVKLLEEILKKL